MSGNGILFLIADLGSGGAQQVLSQIANHWAATGRRIGVATFTDEADDFFSLDDRIERIVLGGIADSGPVIDKLRNNYARVKAIRRALKQFSGHTAVSFIAPMNTLLVAASRGLAYRIIISERNDPARQSYGRAWDTLRRHLYKRADLVTANSRGALETLKGFVPAEKLAYLPNPLRAQPTPLPTDATERAPVFLNVGRLHEQKAQDVLIRAFANIQEKCPDWRLVILGEGSARDALEALAAELGVAHKIDLPGRVSDPFPHYRQASIFVLPSRWEGFPNTLMEAMSCGLPAIVSDATPGPLEVVRDHETGRVVPLDNVEALAEAMLKLAHEPEERLRLGQAGQRCMAPFALERVLEEWDHVIAGQ